MDYEHDLRAATTVTRVGEIVRRLTGADGATFVLRDREFCFYADVAIDRIGLADAPWAPNFGLPGASTPAQLQLG